MKLVSWNVNGLRAVMKKGFMDFLESVNADVICLQEIKLQEGQIDIELNGYHQYFNYAIKKGYSGTAVFTKKEPLSVMMGIAIEEHDQEGRVITLEYDDFFLVTVYTPNSQRDLARLTYRMKWEDDFRDFLLQLDSRKPVVVCGDLNVAHQEIDLKNPKTNHKSAGFTPEERSKMTELLAAGFIDSFRHLYPTETDRYTWWSYFANARDRNIGWRIDYFLLSDRLKDSLTSAFILEKIPGSDHCPVGITICS